MAYCLSKPVFLIGFMGAGKSSVAFLLSERCGVPVVDVDALIEGEQGRAIPDIFSEQGEAAFRSLESAALARLSSGEPSVVACGGGAVERPENVRAMKNGGFVVFLDITFEEASARVGGDPSRPLFADPAAARSLYERRLPLYAQAADARISVAGRSVAEIADECLAALDAAGALLG